MDRVVMGVFNEIDHDGRVERCADAVAAMGFDVLVYALDSGKPYHPAAWRAVRRRLPALGPLRPFVFWLGFVAFVLRTRPRLVHAHDYFLAFPGWLAARLVGARVIYDAHELILPGDHPQRFSERVFYRFERFVAARADGVIAANRKRAELMAAHYGLDRIPAVVRNIPIPEPGMSEPDTLARFPQLARSPGLFRFVYSGFLAPSYGLDGHARAIAALDGNYQFVLVGDGPARPVLADLAARARPGAILLLDRVPRRDLSGVLRLADAGVIAYGTVSPNEIHCSPNKVYEYAQAGLPCLANDNPGLAAILEEGGVGVWAATPEEGVRRMLAEYDRCKAALPAFLAANSWAGEATVVADLYTRVLPILN